MTYRLGVDLGTTFTAAAVANGGKPSMLGLGNRALQVPSVLYLPPGGDLVVGEAAERRGLVDPSRMVREFKRRIGDHVPILVAGVPYSPQALTAQLLRWVVRSGTEQLGEPPARTVLTHPANWGPYKRELLTQIIELADVGDVTTCSEPEAAAIQYAAKSRVPVGARILMYDLGGGTFDSCVLEKHSDGFVMLGESIGIEHLGGVDFDDAVFQHVLESLADEMSGLDQRDHLVQAGLGRLRRDCVDAKEALSTDVETIVPVILPGLNSSVRLTRAELEELIRPPLQETVAAVGRAIRSAGLKPDDLHSIVLVGGGSRIPLVSELLHQAYPTSTALDTHPKHDVALGAVQVGMPPAQWQADPVVTSAPPVPQPAVPEPTGPQFTYPQPDVPQPDVPRPDVPEPAGENPDPASTGPLPPADGPNRRWFTASQVAIGGLVAALIVGVAVVSRNWGDDQAGDPGSSPQQTRSAPTGTTLPTSTALTPQQLLVPLKSVSSWEIFLADTSVAGPVKQLTSDSGGDFSPALSPDRRSVVFVHQEGTTRTLRVMAADGSGVRELFASVPAQCASVFRPAWNPVDPTMLAVACIDQSGAAGLYLIRTDGKVLRQLPVGQDRVDDPAFSPDGKSVAYQAGPDSSFDGGSIFTLPINGDTPRQLTKVSAGTDADPTWSPDGTRIAFRRRQPDGTTSGNFDIFVVPVKGSGPAKAIIKGESDDQDPTWSPDGEQLAVKCNRLMAGGKGAGRARIWVAQSDGTDLRLLWTGGAQGEEGAPAWSRR
ncbi:MAG TPA: Hsp70 family protein [Kineosporiaceae bacterium]|nr:Hsp70 family protein [Kineosporiaceae bacterium]